MFERRITPIYLNTGRSRIKVIQLDNTLRLAHIKEQLLHNKLVQYFGTQRVIPAKEDVVPKKHILIFPSFRDRCLHLNLILFLLERFLIQFARD